MKTKPLKKTKDRKTQRQPRSKTMSQSSQNVFYRLKRHKPLFGQDDGTQKETLVPTPGAPKVSYRKGSGPMFPKKAQPLPKRSVSQKLAATITVSWGYEIHELTLTPKNWAAIKSGRAHSQRGAGYWYEGEFFRDHWHFGGGLDGDPAASDHETVFASNEKGSLTVSYGGDGGVGFDGKLSDADIVEHPYEPKRWRNLRKARRLSIL